MAGIREKAGDELLCNICVVSTDTPQPHFILPQCLPNHLGFCDKGFFLRQIQRICVIQVLIPDKTDAER